MAKPAIYFTVTNDLNYDQRMQRICTSLANAGYDVCLVGRKLKSSAPLPDKPYRQKRLNCFFTKGAAFYAEFNIRLLFYLLSRKHDIICAIDLDTILPVHFAAGIKGSKKVYDAHELFCEMKEIVDRPFIYRSWKLIERFSVPSFRSGYTVNQPIADEFKRMYGVDYEVVRNVPFYSGMVPGSKRTKIILYQGAVNEGRSFETLIPSMKYVDATLVIAGDGNFMQQAKELAHRHNLEEKIKFLGMVAPADLRDLTGKATVGITIFEKGAASNYMSLANRFFDYIHGGTPQVCVDYPVYRELNEQYNIALLVDDLSPENLSGNINRLLSDQATWDRLHRNCITAAAALNWQEEEKVLLTFYRNLAE